MGELTFAESFEVLCLQAGGSGRDDELFGSDCGRAVDVVRPFLVGNAFPEVYLEFPLTGDPFLDVTLLYGDLQEGTRIDSPLAAGTEALLDFYARARAEHDKISCGFELDCHAPVVPAAAVHFQPRTHRDLVQPFCDAAGEPQAAALYLAQHERMPEGWGLSFFGMFRGRPGSPLRVCGYIGEGEKAAARAADSAQVQAVFERAGFTAFDDRMLAQVARVLELAPSMTDFQMDVYPDGQVGSTFAIDIRFDEKRSAEVRESFESGAGARVIKQLVDWGIADERTRHIAPMTFTRAMPIAYDDDSFGAFGFSLVPAWLKIRWRDGELQPAKLYASARAGLVTEKGEGA